MVRESWQPGGTGRGASEPPAGVFRPRWIWRIGSLERERKTSEKRDRETDYLKSRNALWLEVSDFFRRRLLSARQSEVYYGTTVGAEIPLQSRRAASLSCSSFLLFVWKVHQWRRSIR